MAHKKLPKAYSQYGASLGRREYVPPLPEGIIQRFELFRIYLDRDGYDNGGAYWGHAKPLYTARCYCEDADDKYIVELYLRANTRDEAKALVRGQYPEARFKR